MAEDLSWVKDNRLVRESDIYVPTKRKEIPLAPHLAENIAAAGRMLARLIEQPDCGLTVESIALKTARHIARPYTDATYLPLKKQFARELSPAMRRWVHKLETMNKEMKKEMKKESEKKNGSNTSEVRQVQHQDSPAQVRHPS